MDVGERRNSADRELSRKRAQGMQGAGGCCWAALANWGGWQNAQFSCRPKGSMASGGRREGRARQPHSGRGREGLGGYNPQKAGQSGEAVG